MKQKRVMAGIGLAVLSAISVILPLISIFTGDGFMVPYRAQPQNLSMLAEILALFLVSAGIVLFVKRGSAVLFLAGLLACAFCWYHITALPMVVSGLYLFCLLEIGRKIRCGLVQNPEKTDFAADFLLGSSFLIVLFCLLSAVGMGEIRVMRFLSFGIGGILLLTELPALLRNRKEAVKRADEVIAGLERSEKLMLSAVLVLLLIQAGRMAIALDFDTLWYGVRSEYILANGSGGIYENPGLLGMVYVYSKGLEVLTLPLCDLASHSYLQFFGLWLAAGGLFVTFRLASYVTGRKAALSAVLLTAAVPGIMNMSLAAKPDIITWLLQLMMLEFFFRYVKSDAENRRRVLYFLYAAGCYLLSLTMKPTSLVFSTAVFGMMGIYLLASRRFSLRAPVAEWLMLLLPAGALFGIWLRTYLITGMPINSVFTSIFALLGFKIRYPFATGALPGNYQGQSKLLLLGNRLYHMLLAPEGWDMDHVIIAWGTSLLFFFGAGRLLLSLLGFRGKKEEDPQKAPLVRAAHTVFWPFLAVNLVSLVMLYQVDGNYFMLLYSMILLGAVYGISRLSDEQVQKSFVRCTVPAAVFAVFVLAYTNWAWSAGFTEGKLINKGRVNHRAQEQERLMASGNHAIWYKLAEDPANRIISIGAHPFCLQFACNAQSYLDVTEPWGNAAVDDSPEAFEEYMEYAETDYLYIERNYIGPDGWPHVYELVRDLIARGTFTDFLYEGGNVLMAVAKEKVPAEEAAANLADFDTFYQTYVPPAD